MRRLAPVVLILLSCAQQKAPSDFALRIAAVGPLAPVEPAIDYGYTLLLKGLVFSAFFLPQSNGGLQSPIFSDWERLGPTRYRMKLDRSLYFSDGSQARNEDVIASLAPWQIRGTERDGWIEIEPVDAPSPIDPLLLQVVLFRRGPTGPLGTGPFVVAAQSPGCVQLIRRIPAPGRVGKVELVAFSTARDALARALIGEVNVLIMPDPGQIELLEGMSRFKIVHSPGVQVIAAVFNARRLSPSERKALADALPVAEIARAHGGRCEVDAPAGPSALVPPGGPLKLVVVETDPSISRAALALRRALGSRGDTLKTVEGNIPAESVVNKWPFDVMITPLRVWPASHAPLRWHTGAKSNHVGYSNAAVDRALDVGDYSQAERELERDPPAVYLCRPQRSVAVDARVRIPQLGPYDLFQSLAEWEVAP